MVVQKISPNLKNESTESESSKTAKMFFFFFRFFSPSSDGLAQYCVDFSRWFTHETAAFYTEQCTTPSLLHNIEVSQGARSHLLKTRVHNKGEESIELRCS